MGEKSVAKVCVACLVACAVVGGEAVYLYFGISALIDQYDAAEGCGWW